MDSELEPQTIKLIVVGDGSVGKTCILLSYTTDKFPTEYVPTVFENYTAQVVVDQKIINLSLWYTILLFNYKKRDTAGQESYNQLRTLCYTSADIFFIIFAVTDPTSFDNALNKWYPELNAGELANVPKMIIGNKIDMRDDRNTTHIREEAARAICQQKNITYLECSALTQEGLKKIFDEAMKITLRNRQNENNKKVEPPKKQQSKESCCQTF